MQLDEPHEVGPLERRGLDHRRQEADEVQLRVEQCLDLQDAHQRMRDESAHTVDRFLVELDRREHEVGGSECRDEPDVGLLPTTVARVPNSTDRNQSILLKNSVSDQTAMFEVVLHPLPA